MQLTTDLAIEHEKTINSVTSYNYKKKNNN